jgi:hypothetical protein
MSNKITKWMEVKKWWYRLSQEERRSWYFKTHLPIEARFYWRQFKSWWKKYRYFHKNSENFASQLDSWKWEQENPVVPDWEEKFWPCSCLSGHTWEALEVTWNHEYPNDTFFIGCHQKWRGCSKWYKLSEMMNILLGGADERAVLLSPGQVYELLQKCKQYLYESEQKRVHGPAPEIEEVTDGNQEAVRRP